MSLGLRDEGSGLQRAELPDLVRVGTRADADGPDALPFREDDGPGAVPEQDAGGAVLPRGHPGRFLGADDEDVLHLPDLEVGVGDVQGVDEARTGAVDVDTGAVQAHGRGDDAAQARGHVLVDHVGTEQEVDVFRLPAGIGQGLQRRITAEVLQPLVGNDVAGMDSRPGHDPVVGRVQETLQVTVGDHFLRQRASGTDDLHK